MSKLLWTVLIIPALAYGAIAALLFFFQDRLAYYPRMGRELELDPHDFGLDHTPLTLTTTDGERLDAMAA